MKKLNLIINCAILFFSITVTAQLDRRNDIRSNSMNTPEADNEKRQEVFEKEKAKYIEKTVAKLKTDLDLDALQEIAIKQIITESGRIEGIILKKEEGDEAKMKAIQSLSETTDTKVTALLNPVQKEKFIILKENLKKKKK